MTPSERKTAIFALSVDHPARVAFESAQDELCAKLLNEKTVRGPVPIEVLSAYCTSEGITGLVETIAHEPTSEQITLQLKALCRTILTLIRDDYRLTTADVDHANFGPACDGLIAAGLMTPTQKTAIIALADNQLAIMPGVNHLQIAEARAA